MTRLNFNIVFTIEGPHQQQQQNHCLRTDNSLSHLVVGVNVFYWRKIFSLDYIVVKTHNLSSSHRGFLINYKLKQVLPLPPLGMFADIFYLKENFKTHRLRDVSLCDLGRKSLTACYICYCSKLRKKTNESLS